LLNGTDAACADAGTIKMAADPAMTVRRHRFEYIDKKVSATASRQKNKQLRQFLPNP
jgi:hypothetical protein